MEVNFIYDLGAMYNVEKAVIEEYIRVFIKRAHPDTLRFFVISLEELKTNTTMVNHASKLDTKEDVEISARY